VESAELGRRGEVEAEGTGRNCPGIWLAAAGTREIARGRDWRAIALAKLGELEYRDSVESILTILLPKLLEGSLC
jgi:hypothetical protein